MSKQSIGQRFGITLVANISKSLLTFVTGLMIARALGPEDYGQYAFLLASFLSIRSLTDMGSSNAFFTFVSQQSREKIFYFYYGLWLAAQFLVPLVIIILLPNAWLKEVWKGDDVVLIVAAFSASFMQHTVWNFIAQLGESQRLTQRVQILNIVIAFSHFIIVVIFLSLGHKHIASLYGFIILELFVALCFIAITWPSKLAFKQSGQRLPARQFFNEFAYYCWPLLPYAWVSFAYGFADAWLLQHFGGSVQQAYYSVGAQIATISLVATTSILRILWKEIAEAHHQGDSEKVKILYFNTCQWLYFFAAMVSGFLVPWASDIIRIALGPQYMSGVTTLTLMLFYPVHQTLGQITGSMYYAIEKTKYYVLLGMGSMLLSIGVAYIVLASPENSMIGLGLGSIGLALKMLVIQLFSVNLSIWLLCRLNKWPYYWLYQVLVLSITLILGYASYYIFSVILLKNTHLLLQFVCSGVLYTLCLAAIVWRFSIPLLSVTQAELYQFQRRIIGKIFNKHPI